MKNYLDELDKRILNMLQNDFPISSQPYADLSETLHITEDELLSRIKALKERRVIRRLGAVLDAEHLGFYSTLCAAKIEPERIEAVAAHIGQEIGVTHNYWRDHDYNLWFTLTGPGKEWVENTIERLRHETGFNLVSMPAQKKYKIKVILEV